MKKTVAIFGSTGGIGSATRQAFLDDGYTVIPVSRNLIDFSSEKADEYIQEFLKNCVPDVIVNCVGHFDQNDAPAATTMNVNFNCNWSIVRHYLDKKDITVKIIMIGSSACRYGRKDYIVYAASKAALLSLWQGANEIFDGSSVSVNLINPVRTKTPLTEKQFGVNDRYLETSYVANEILQLANSSADSKCIDLTYKEI
jgi:short-subunit dehydrogenase